MTWATVDVGIVSRGARAGMAALLIRMSMWIEGWEERNLEMVDLRIDSSGFERSC